ncbi:unnamed protein product [Anisakis simplex]|uniref:MHD1 domain-containing protein n=1 Tax=Anisakis simplex TaxID=6269 RepID=A0A0M3JNC1_ANISI|nr:unnamed protein product [Anisakis simplex]
MLNHLASTSFHFDVGGKVEYDSRDGCATSEDIYWKLDALQGFVQDLNWPEEEFAKYLQVRMKALASEMISKCANWYAMITFLMFSVMLQNAVV